MQARRRRRTMVGREPRGQSGAPGCSGCFWLRTGWSLPGRTGLDPNQRKTHSTGPDAAPTGLGCGHGGFPICPHARPSSRPRKGAPGLPCAEKAKSSGGSSSSSVAAGPGNQRNNPPIRDSPRALPLQTLTAAPFLQLEWYGPHQDEGEFNPSYAALLLPSLVGPREPSAATRGSSPSAAWRAGGAHCNSAGEAFPSTRKTSFVECIHLFYFPMCISCLSVARSDTQGCEQLIDKSYTNKTCKQSKLHSQSQSPPEQKKP